MRLFAGDRIKDIMERFKLPDDQPMEAKILSNQIESAQKKVEEQNFVARKNVLKYDDVMNTQRQVSTSSAAACSTATIFRTRCASGSARSSSRMSPTRPRATSRRIGTRGLIAQMQGLRHRHHGRGAARGGRARARGADRGVRRGRARDLRREGEPVRPRADARDRALRDAAGRRLALEKPPRLDGLPPRRHPSARDGAKGPARRVPRRGARDFEELGGSIREEVVLTLFDAQIEVNEPAARAGAGPTVNLQYQHETSAGSGSDRSGR